MATQKRKKSGSKSGLIGKELLNYRITEKIGAGGQGDVYKATDIKLDRTVVLKVLPADLTSNASNLARFEREARIASSLDHPNICSIYSFDSADGLYFIAMQFVEGRNVREIVAGRALELKSTLSIAAQVCDALAAAHARGIIHRDIKANNVMVTAEGQVKILDFGLAKLLEEGSSRENKSDRKDLTEIGVPYGTATYAAPEQAQGQKVDERADIFSTGVLLYEMLTGKWPFDGDTTLDVRYKVVNEVPRPLSEARSAPVPPKLQEIIDRAMAKKPADRYQKVSEMRDDLRVLLHDISVNEDPDFIDDLSLSAPRHLGGDSHLGLLGWIGSSRGLAVGSLVIFFLGAVLSVWLLTGGFKKSIFSSREENIILRLAGSNTIGAKLAPALVEEFLKELGARDIRTSPGESPEEVSVSAILPGDSDPKIVEISSHGSSTAFIDLAEKKCDVGLSSRKIKPDEIEKLAALGDMTSAASEHVIALDGLAVIVNRKNSLDSLTREQIAKIFSGEVKNWSQLLVPGGHINIYARDEKSGTFDSFQALILGNIQIQGDAQRFEDSNELSDAVSRDVNGIGFIGFPYVRDAKAVAVSDGDAMPLLPNRLTVSTEDYILSRRLYLYTPLNPDNAWARKFLDFAISKTGQEIVGKAGFVAQNLESTREPTVGTAPGEYQNLTKNAERVSLNFRFQKGGKELDNKAQLDLDRVVEFLTDSNLSGENVLLLGFADDGGEEGAEKELSEERAMIVAERLRRRGISPSVIAGFGDNLPVASNATEDGREKNRRVELWLRR